MNKFPTENIYGHTKKLKYIIEQVNEFILSHEKPIKILDFGCGNGSAVSQYLIREEIQYYGVDIHEPSLEYAKEHFGSEKASFSHKIPEKVIFDIIIYSDVLEHLTEPINILKEHNSILRNGGIIIGAVPNGYGPFENEKRLDKFLRLSAMVQYLIKIKRKLYKNKERLVMSQIPYNGNSGHVQFFTKKSLFKIIRQGGFEIISFRKGGFVGAPLSERILNRKTIIKLNVKIADIMPACCVSSWYFTAKK